MKTKKEIQNWILENCVDKHGDIDHMDLDFGNYRVFTNRMKATEIWQSGHEADFIEQACHEAKRIDQEGHKSEDVLEGKHTIIKPKKSVTLELTEEQLEKVKRVLEENEE